MDYVKEDLGEVKDDHTMVSGDSGIPRIDYSPYYRSSYNLLCTTGTHQALIGRTLSVIFPTIFWDEDVRPIVDNT